MKDELIPLMEKEKRASEFLQKVRELSSEMFIQNQKEFEHIYRNLGVKVLEWEDMISSVNHEEKIIERIGHSLQNGIADLNTVMEIRDQYKTIKYLKDIRIEIRLMMMYLQLLRLEYERRQELIISDDSIKPAIDFVLLSVLIGELDDLTFRMKTSEISLKSELIALTDNHKFIYELYNDVKRHLEYNIYGLSLESLNSQNIKKSFKKFVDITGPILDYKINLEIQEREKNNMSKVMIVPKETQPKRSAIILESKMSREKEIQPLINFSNSFQNNNNVPHISQNLQEKGHLSNQNLVQVNKGELKDANTGKPIYHHPFRDEQEPVPIKPTVNRNIVNSDLRNYYCKNWKKMMENNSYLDISGLDALMASKSLEKAIYDKIKKNPLEYDVLCASISNTLRHIINFRNISIHLRNESFKPNILLLYCDKPLGQLRKMEKNLKHSDGGSQPYHGNNNTNNQTGNNFRRRNNNFHQANGEQEGVQGGVAPTYNRYNNHHQSRYNNNGYANDGSQEIDPEAANMNKEVQYKNYNVFTGSFIFEGADKSVKPFDEVTLMTCSGYERIIQFSEIPKKIVLSSKIDKSHFIDYITNIFHKPQDYKFMSGWVTYKKIHSGISAYLTKQGCVASQQYTPNCKIFIFPVGSLDPSWLGNLPIYTTTSKIELMFFLVYKKKSAVYEQQMSPKLVPFTGQTVYRFISGLNKIGLKPSSLDRIKEHSKQNKIGGGFGEYFADGNESGAKKKDTKPSNKLQFLIEKAEMIEKVPNSIIEEESRLERNRTLAATTFNFDEESVEEDDEPFIITNNFAEETFHEKNYNIDNYSDPIFEDRTNAPFEFPSIGGVDKNEFIKNAVSSIQLPTHKLISSGRNNNNSNSNNNRMRNIPNKMGGKYHPGGGFGGGTISHKFLL